MASTERRGRDINALSWALTTALDSSGEYLLITTDPTYHPFPDIPVRLDGYTVKPRKRSPAPALT